MGCIALCHNTVMQALANFSVCSQVEEEGQKHGIHEAVYAKTSHSAGAGAVLSRDLFIHSSISAKRPEWGRQEDLFLRKGSAKNLISP